MVVRRIIACEQPLLLLIPGKTRKIEATHYIRDIGYIGHVHALVRYDEDIASLVMKAMDTPQAA
jgi:hypothetical protein